VNPGFAHTTCHGSEPPLPRCGRYHRRIRLATAKMGGVCGSLTFGGLTDGFMGGATDQLNLLFGLDEATQALCLYI
jgi:hypothetical protein